MAGTLTIGGAASGLLTGQNIIGPITDTGTAVVGGRVDMALASGDNTMSVPVGATHVLIELPLTNAVMVTLRTDLNVADNGLPIGPTGFVKLPIYPGTATLILNAAGSTGTLEATFI